MSTEHHNILLIESIAAGAENLFLPVAGGNVQLRHWRCTGRSEKSKETILLLHGGSGSWLHWFRNIEPLRAAFDVFAIDLPGLGDSVLPKEGSDAAVAADMVLSAIDRFLPSQFHVVAFSWGCTITAMLMKRLESRLRSVMLTGPAAVGDLPRRQQMKPLIKRHADMTAAEVFAAQEENLARLMIHDRNQIDSLAVTLQTINTSKARFSSPQYARSTLVLDGVSGTKTPLFVIYGEYDAPAYPELDARRRVFQQVRPDVQFELVPNAGHWLQYEQAEVFNARCAQWIERNI